VNTLLARHRRRVREAVATGLLKIKPDFFTIKPTKTNKEATLKPANISKINA